MEELDIIELFIDEENDLNGIEAISIVEHPAIEEDFYAFNEQGKLELAKVDDEKRILMGAALIPNKKIYRNNGTEEYFIFFCLYRSHCIACFFTITFVWFVKVLTPTTSF